MMGEVSAQGNLFAADHLHLEFVGSDSFYGWLGREGLRLFPDEDFAALYVLDNGRYPLPRAQAFGAALANDAFGVAAMA